MRTKIAILLIVAFAIAALGGGWKWRHHVGSANGEYRIAGWTWGDDAAVVD